MNAGRLSAVAVALLLAGAPLTLTARPAGRRVAAAVAALATVLALAAGVAAQLARPGSWRAPVLVTDLPGLSIGNRLVGGGVVGVLALTVVGVTLAVQLFAAWYLADDDRYAQFAATVSLFSGAMLLLVVSRDLVVTLAGWEVMGWCSYLLIGHWSRRDSARRAALKAFLVTRLADVGFVVGVVALVATFGTTDIGQMIRLGTNCEGLSAYCQDLAPSPVVTFGLTALVIGVLGKSAQIPFQDWLTDAMEGPTPASALIHAATMVAAGTWVLAQFAPLLTYAAPAQWVLAASVSATMVYAGFTAFLQTDLKRLLAWSTISQIAVMLAPIAAAPAVPHIADASRVAADASVAHLYGHAIFKALLFLTVGWLSVLAGGTSARVLTGSGRRARLAHVAWTLGLLSLAGVPLTVGGFTKEQVIHAATNAGIEGATPGLRQWIVTGALLLTVALTAAYAARAFAVVSAGPTTDGDAVRNREAGDPASPRATATLPDSAHAPDAANVDPAAAYARAGAHAPADAHAPGASFPTKAAIAALALACLAGSLVFRTGPLHGGEFSLLILGLTVGLLLIGGIVGWFLRPDDALDPSPWMLRASAGFGADRAYRGLVAAPVLGLARGVAHVDREIVDLYVRAAAGTARGLGAAGTRAHARERVATNLVWVFVGLLALAGVALWA
ncbi:MAG: proton-conducting transporter membrane subunit [Dermatophilaceae bacterium]